MPDVIPPMNLAPEATPWGRTIQNLVVEIQRNLERQTSAGANTTASVQSSNRVTTQNVQTLAALTTGLQAQINALFASGIVTTTVAASGAVTAGSLSVVAGSTLTGTVVTGGDLTVGGLIRNVAAYSNPITSSYRAVWVTSVDGQFGYNLSSREFKQDIVTAVVDPKLILKLRAVTYRYIQAVETYGAEAAMEFGLIAEEVHEAGLTFLVDYDPDTGKPAGIKFHLVAIALLTVMDDHETRLQLLETEKGGASR